MPSDVSLPAVLHTWVEVFMHRSFRDFRRFMEEAGLSHSQVGALMILHHHHTTGVSDIAERLGITVAAASQMVARLVKQDLLERTEDPADRRFKQVSLSTKGKDLIESGIAYRQRWMEQLTQELTPEEQEIVTGALSLLTQAARQLDAVADQVTDASKPSNALEHNEEKQPAA